MRHQAFMTSVLELLTEVAASGFRGMSRSKVLDTWRIGDHPAIVILIRYKKFIVTILDRITSLELGYEGKGVNIMHRFRQQREGFVI